MTNSWAMLPHPTQPGQVGGHEGVGKVVKFGPGTEERSAVKMGDRVGIKWMAGICETCEACRAGADACCFNGVCLFCSFLTQSRTLLDIISFCHIQDNLSPVLYQSFPNQIPTYTDNPNRKSPATTLLAPSNNTSSPPQTT